MPRLLGVYLLPPLAIARLGRSATPLDSYVWRDDPTIHGASRTVIEPALTFAVEGDGSLTPFYPAVIRFRDGADLRPVAPFFEVWGTVAQDDGTTAEVPITATLLAALGSGLRGVSYAVTVANRKAARRTGDEADAFVAQVRVRGDDFTPHRLDAFTPPLAGRKPLVSAEHPIPLGSFRVVRPVRRTVAGADLDVLRVRFTPASGEVYGPPAAVVGQDSWTARTYEIVPPRNRILAADSSWSRYTGSYAVYTNPEPFDTYDGADEDDNLSWGVVDDTCDGVVTVEIVAGAERFTASARVSSGPPDYAPDRRPFVSLADDLADRDLDPATREELLAHEADTQARIADLFARVWETAELANLDGMRVRGLGDNDPLPRVDGLPYTDDNSFRPQDAPFADDKVRDSIPEKGTPPGAALPWTAIVPLAHDRLADEDELILFLLTATDRVRRMVRSAYGAFADLDETVAADSEPNPRFRDPRVARDLMHDMRMPPYMRDELARALSLTRRQFAELMAYLGPVTPTRRGIRGTAADVSDVRGRLPVARRMAARMERAAAAPAPDAAQPAREKAEPKRRKRS